MKNKCALCNGELKRKIVDYEVYGQKIGSFPALVCTSCKEKWFNEKTSKEIGEIEKKTGIFGLSIETKVGYSGNSLIIRIPSALAKFMNIKKETRVLLYPENKDKMGVMIR